MAYKKKKKLSKKESKALKKQELISDAQKIEAPAETSNIAKEKKIVNIPQIITVRDFAVRLNIPITVVIAELMKNGIMATINESIDFDTAVIIADELGYEVKNEVIEEKAKIQKIPSDQVSKNKLQHRPPVIVVMGHVDHGKTTLLDFIRKTNVVGGESGGITQHIGAYQVEIKRKNQKNQLVTFLDTPGHEAFSAMRAHGANITDIAILVVAADDGVKPQTKEAISHAKAANLPIIVAINKSDKPHINIEAVKRQLADADLLSEEWGGKTIMVPVSAKTGENVDKLLEMALIVAEVEELKADYSGPAQGVIIESHMQKGLGAVATILVQSGILRTNDAVIAGKSYGKIKRMENDRGNIIKEALPSMPVKIMGLSEPADFGQQFRVVSEEKIARSQAGNFEQHKRKVLSLGEISQKIKKGEIKELNLILKADTQGSLEAIKDALTNLSSEFSVVKIVHDNLGDISESDVNLAISTKSVVIGFHVGVSQSAQQLANVHNVKISTYDIIYNLVDDLSAGLEGMLEPIMVEEIVGKLKVLKIFKEKKDYKVIGGRVAKGRIIKNAQVRIVHEGEILGFGVIDSLEQNKKSNNEVLEGFECGLGIKTSCKILEEDVLEVIVQKEEIRKVSAV